MIWNHLLASALFVHIAVVAPADAQTPPTVGRDTTFYVEPLDDEGYVDYRAALEQAFGDADTANADNAFVGIFENLDTSDWNADYLATLRQRLNLKPPADDAELFVGLPDYAVARGVAEGVADELLYDALDGTLDDEHAALVDEWLAAIEAPLARISDALRRPNYFTPMILLPGDHALIDVLLPHLGSHRTIAKAYVFRIVRDLAADDLDAAVDDILTLHRFARLQTRESALISTLVGISIEALSFDGTRALLNHEKVTAAHVAELKAGFAVLPEARPVGMVISRGERALSLDMTQQTARGRVGLLHMIEVLGNMDDVPEEEPDPAEDPFVKLMQDPRFDDDVMLRQINAFWDEHFSPDAIGEDFLKNKAGDSPLDEAVEALQLDHDEMVRLSEIGLSGIPAGADSEAISRRMGDYLPRLMAPALDAAVRTDTQIKTLHQLEEVGLALASYKLANGEYPPLLLSLVPAYLDAVPRDPFTGKQLIYRRQGEGYLLYSVSADREDDGGLDDRSSDGDLVLRVGEPDAAAE